jgi:pectate lyase
MSEKRRSTALFTVASASVVLATAGIFTAVSASAAAGCRVDYTATQWSGGFGANVTVTNLGDAINGWTLTWSYPAGQTAGPAWNATLTQSGTTVTAKNAPYNAAIPTSGSASFGFNGTATGSIQAPAAFTLNGVACTGGVTGPTGNPSPSTSAPDPGPSTPPPNPPSGLVGWATQGGGTTGGGTAAATTVTSSSALSSAVSGTNAAVVRVSGTISCSGMLAVGSNKTIIGAAGATISGCGLNVNRATNVIIRNLTFRNWNDDAINVQYSTRVWIDHNSLSNGYDGAIDVKRASDYVTVSWNRISNHNKAMLLGHSDDNGGEDRGKLRVTYHHNWFDGTGQRHPRVRFGNPVHVVNNYYNSIGGYGVASTKEACVIVEGNYFENTDDPYHRGEGDSPAANLTARNNTFVNSGSGQAGGSACAGLPYSYAVEAPGGVKASVTAGAGAGRISL